MELKSILEALLFSSQKPLSPRELREAVAAAALAEEESETQEEGLAAQPFKKVSEQEIEVELQELEREFDEAKRTFSLACVAGAWQFVNRPEYARWIRALVGERSRPSRLSQPALETVAIIAYRQPITRAEIEQIRGVSVDGVLQTLLERGLVEQTGRAEVLGRPMTFGTSSVFLEYFGLRSLADLPAADELRRIPVQTEEARVPQEGLATVPPESLATASAPESPEEPASEEQAREPSAPAILDEETPPDTAEGEKEAGDVETDRRENEE